MIVNLKNELSEEAGFIEEDNFIKDPFTLRDPFKAPEQEGLKTLSAEEKKLQDRKKGIFTNKSTPPIADINDLKIVGVLVGKERMALAKIGKSGATFPLKEGMRIGDDQIKLRAILPGGVVFVEEITNVYGQKEYLETVIPISK